MKHDRERQAVSPCFAMFPGLDVECPKIAGCFYEDKYVTCTYYINTYIIIFIYILYIYIIIYIIYIINSKDT